MNLGDVTSKSVPKMTLVCPGEGGAISTRTFIPHRCHASIGVLGAVSVATACLLPGSPAAALAQMPGDGRLPIEHPTGRPRCCSRSTPTGTVVGAGTLRTARKLMDGRVFPRADAWVANSSQIKCRRALDRQRSAALSHLICPVTPGATPKSSVLHV